MSSFGGHHAMVFLTLLVIAVGVLSLLAMGLVGLFEAPWQVLLFMLISALGVLQWLSGQSQASHSPVPPKVATSATSPTPASPPTSPPTADQTPDQSDATASTELVYRGIHYQLQTSPEPDPKQPSEPILEGTYRGHHWQRSLTHPAIATDHSDEITYRGCKVRKMGGREEGGGRREEGGGRREERGVRSKE